MGNPRHDATSRSPNSKWATGPVSIEALHLVLRFAIEPAAPWLPLLSLSFYGTGVQLPFTAGLTVHWSFMGRRGGVGHGAGITHGELDSTGEPSPVQKHPGHRRDDQGVKFAQGIS